MGERRWVADVRWRRRLHAGDIWRRSLLQERTVQLPCEGNVVEQSCEVGEPKTEDKVLEQFPALTGCRGIDDAAEVAPLLEVNGSAGHGRTAFTPHSDPFAGLVLAPKHRPPPLIRRPAFDHGQGKRSERLGFVGENHRRRVDRQPAARRSRSVARRILDP
jgi:hypothetical protein